VTTTTDDRALPLLAAQRRGGAHALQAHAD
jgi:hypothetical protein